MTIPPSDSANAAGSNASRASGAYASLTGPVWAGEYVFSVSDITGGSAFLRELLPVGVVVRHVLDDGRGTFMVPDQVACPSGFVGDSARGAWVLGAPEGALVDGFRACASAVVNGVGVEVLEVWGERARVRELAGDDSGQWVGLGELGRVVVDQTAFLSWKFRGGRTDGSSSPLKSRRFRRVFPVGFDAWSSPERVGGVGVDVWSSHWASPVPASGSSFMVLGGVPYPKTYVMDRDARYDGPASMVYLDAWCQVPVGVGVGRPWQGELCGSDILNRDAEGFVGVDCVRAMWGGRAVEVVYVAYSYAYVVALERPEAWRSRKSLWSLDELEVMEGPVRLDELEDVRFSVYVRRHPEAGSWSFLNAWGLPGDLEGSAEARLERGCWPAWPVTHEIGPI